MSRFSTYPMALVALLGMNVVAAQPAKPSWSDVNRQVIDQYKVKGRTRTDIPATNTPSNLTGGKVTNIATLPVMSFGAGIEARAYWGQGALISFITMKPKAAFPTSTLTGERFLFIMSGDVQELVNGQATPMVSRPADNPDGIHGRLPVRDFLYLQTGARTSITAGDSGAKILEVYSPVPQEYLKKAGIRNMPAAIDISKFPIEPSVEPNKLYNLYDLQMAELVPGSNSRIVSGRGVQMSFLRMDANAFFARHIHPEEQIMYTFRGSIDEILLDKSVNMKSGDIVDLPSDFVHGGQLGPYGCDVMDVFFPTRTDYNAFRLRRDSAFHTVIPEGATVKTLVDGATSKPGLTFTEGPAWMNGKLYFSSMHFDQAFTGDPGQSATVAMTPDGGYRYISSGKMQTNGIIAAPNGKLWVCDMFGHRIVEMDTSGNVLRTLVDSFGGKPLDGPNDLVMDAKGGIYFSDPQFTADKVKNQPGRTAYYRSAEGKLTRILEPDAFAMPNGLALSPDGKTLYINNTYDDEKFWNVNSDKDNYVWAYDVAGDGGISNGRKFALLNLSAEVLDRKGKTSGADGMRVDEKGNLWVATWIGVQIFNADGKFLGIINTPTYPVSIAFGGSDGQTLYITSYDKIYTIQTSVKGLFLHP